MREKEIKEEFELCIRSFIDAKERSEQKGLDEFDELRILEASFNRLFISVEHLCNALMLFEKGNFSKKHFGDFTKFKELKEKYKSDLASLYQRNYHLRSYGDYRKFSEVKPNFNKNELKRQVAETEQAIRNSLAELAKSTDISEFSKRMNNK